MYFIYLLRCTNRSLYCGYTNNLAHRIKQHRFGKAGAKYTKRFKPVALEVAWQLDLILGDVLRAEYAIKQLQKFEKESLVKLPQELPNYLNLSFLTAKEMSFLTVQEIDDIWQASEVIKL